MIRFFTTTICLFLLLISNGQQLITFKSTDSLDVTADLYESFKNSHKYMLMFHQEEYSRGEYQQIASRIIKLDMNCLAVDLRYGKEINFTNNETAMLAKKNEIPVSMISCEKDILGAINYIYSIDSAAQIFLMGSSFSGSLCLKIAKDRTDLKAVLAFSPGEFFSDLNITEYIADMQTPTYIGCSRSEYPYVSKIAEKITAPKTVVFEPEESEGLHGATNLWWESDSSEEFWLSLLFFLKDF